MCFLFVLTLDKGRTVTPEDYTTLWGWVTFSWVYPLVRRVSHRAHICVLHVELLSIPRAGTQLLMKMTSGISVPTSNPDLYSLGLVELSS